MTEARAGGQTTLAIPSLPVERFELRSGATLLVSRRPDAQVCAVQVHLRGGFALDAPGLEGTAFLAGALVDQGTKAFTEEEIASVIEDSGGTFEGSSTGMSASVASKDWKALLEIVAECITVPLYPRQRFERQRRRLLDRLLIERDDPRTQGTRLLRKLVYGKHFLGRPEYGSLDSVAEIRRKHVVEFHRRNWCGKRTVIAFCGDVEPSAVRRLLDRRLEGWKPGKDLVPSEERFPAVKPRVAAFSARRQQVHVYLGHLGIRRRDPDFAPLLVMDHILGTGPGFTNRISRRLRDELGLAYTVQAQIHQTAAVLPGVFMAYIGTSPEHLRTAVEGFREEIHHIQRELVLEDELSLAKSYLTGALPISFERASRRVQELIVAHRCELPHDHLERIAHEIEAVGLEDVRRVARQHLFPDEACLVAAGPVTKRELAELT